MAGPRILSSPSPPSEEMGTVLLETERLIIRRYYLSDAPAMAEIGNDTAVSAYMRARFPSPYTLSDAENFLAMACKGDGTAYPHHNGIFLKPLSADNPSPEPRFIGAIGVMPKDDVYFRTWEIGYWLGSAMWGRGYATEATRAFVRWCFETWPGLNRFEGEIIERNEASQKVLKKCGFVEEGRRRGAVDKHGVVMDEVHLGLLRSEVEGIKELTREA
ncbi:n-acetyltransferase p20 [Fusarium albosuccineum]|uniref:N-acetyltransferase p20 n=1 Tax=Fusarium albosuccineum TaxID=1237068 RepID=A0A8H4LG43_9HYPO|nr:n-acetyltransferase p20 [Fusarium albosuccineum]